jgi:hypothetical protein
MATSGLISSTLLSLVFVPAAFAVMDDIDRLAWRLFSRFIGPAEEADAATSRSPAQAGPQPLPAAAE